VRARAEHAIFERKRPREYGERPAAEQTLETARAAVHRAIAAETQQRDADWPSLLTQLHALADNLSNFMRTLAMPKTVELWSLIGLREKLIKIGAEVVCHGRYVTFQMVEVAVSLFADVLSLIARLQVPPAPA
jgi:hypothetical protein